MLILQTQRRNMGKLMQSTTTSLEPPTQHEPKHLEFYNIYMGGMVETSEIKVIQLFCNIY